MKEEFENELYELTGIMSKIKDLKSELKELESYKEGYEALILSEMEKRNLENCDTDELKIKYVKPVTVKQVDVALLQEKYPNIYEEVVKDIQRKSSLRITLKKGN